jgi:preprotein translocase subunit SecG
MMIENLVLIVHVLLGLGIVAFVLIQRGKGADAGASFGGGASQTVFGSGGNSNFLTRTTAILAAGFFLTSFGLAYLAKQKADGLDDLGLDIPAVEQTQDAPVQPQQNRLDIPAE